MEAKRKVDQTGAERSSPASSEAQLVKACLRGEEAAWRALVERHAALVYSVSRRCGLDEHETEDIFQEVFIHLFRQLPSLRDPQSLPKWLITTTHRCAWRCRNSGGELKFDSLSAPGPEPAEELVEQWERRHLVAVALQRLGGRCARLLTMMFRSGSDSKYDEIAIQMGVPRGSLGPTRARCLRKLARVLEEMGVQGD